MDKRELTLLKKQAKEDNVEVLLWLIEQAEKVEKLENKLEVQNIKLSNCRKKLKKIKDIVNV